MKVLDLFSGIGGFSLGLERAGMNTVAFCEIEPFCQEVLKKYWPDVPIYNDVRSLDYGGAVDVICGGFPCQPFSTAGNQKGTEDDRHLWPAMFSLIKKYKPRWVIGENVAGIINMALDDVLAELESENYTTTSFVIPACAINAPHRRDRVWIVGYSEHDGSFTAEKRGEPKETGRDNAERKEKASEPQRAGRPKDNEAMAYTTSERQQGQGEFIKRSGEKENGEGETNFFESISIGRIWGVEPELGRVANGVPDRMDRLRALGNAVVPQIPEIIGRAIMNIENERGGEHG